MLWLSLIGRLLKWADVHRHVQAVGGLPPSHLAGALHVLWLSGGFLLAGAQARPCDCLQMYVVSGNYKWRVARWSRDEERL